MSAGDEASVLLMMLVGSQPNADKLQLQVGCHPHPPWSGNCLPQGRSMELVIIAIFKNESL